MTPTTKDMKKFIICLILILSTCFVYGQGSQRMMKKELTNRVDVRGVADFKVYNSTTLEDDVEYQLKVYHYYLSWHYSWYDAFYQSGDQPQKIEQYKDAISKDWMMINHLHSIEENYKDIYDNITFTTYRLTYLYVDSTGKKISDFCFAKFNNKGKMVAFKQTGTSKWEILGDTVSIPDFHQYESHL